MPGREEGVRALPTEGFVPAGQELLTNGLGSDSFAQRLRAESDPVGRLVLLRNELSIDMAFGRLNTAIVIWDALWERSELDEILRTSVLLRETPDPSH